MPAPHSSNPSDTGDGELEGGEDAAERERHPPAMNAERVVPWGLQALLPREGRWVEDALVLLREAERKAERNGGEIAVRLHFPWDPQRRDEKGAAARGQQDVNSKPPHPP